MVPSNKPRQAGSDMGKQRDSLLLYVILRWILKTFMKEFSQLFISSTHLDDLLEISNVHALSLHYLHDHAIHVVQMGVTVAGPPRRWARRADVATRTTHTAVSGPWNTGQHTVQTRGAKNTWQMLYPNLHKQVQHGMHTACQASESFEMHRRCWSIFTYGDAILVVGQWNALFFK